MDITTTRTPEHTKITVEREPEDDREGWHGEIVINRSHFSGRFEHETMGQEWGGGLEFEIDGEGRLALVDYDGVFELPASVIKGLEAAAVVVSEEFN